jgi:hypothetical protein
VRIGRAGLAPLHHALLLRELLNKKNWTIEITVGRRLEPEEFRNVTEVGAITRCVRSRLESLTRG